MIALPVLAVASLLSVARFLSFLRFEKKPPSPDAAVADVSSFLCLPSPNKLLRLSFVWSGCPSVDVGCVFCVPVDVLGDDCCCAIKLMSAFNVS